MKFTRIRAIARKEITQVIRDPLSLALAFLMPVILLFIFGYAITMDVNNLSTVIYDPDNSSLSRELIRELEKSGYFTITGYAASEGEIDRYIDAGKARVALNIPDDFSKRINKGESTPLQVVVDGSDSNTATIAIGYVSTIVGRFTKHVGKKPHVSLIDPRVRVWYNPELKSRNFIIPGLIAVIMAIIAALLTSLTIAREWERGTMEQLISTPVKGSELIIGKLSTYFAIGLIDVIIAILICVFLFDVPLKGSLFLLIVLSSIFLFGGLSLGILISILTKSQLLASQLSMIVSYLPALLLSGFMFSISNMPAPLQVITYIIPARYFVAILKGIFLKGSPFGLMAFESLLLTVYGALVFIIANKRFKKRIG